MASPIYDLVTNMFGYGGPISEWASVLSVAVSGYAAVTIKRVRSQILGRVHLPRLKNEIKSVTSALSTALSNYNNDKRQFELNLARCEAHLKKLKGVVKGTPHTTTKKILKKIKGFNRSSDEAWEIYTLMNMLIEELKHALEDQKFGG